MEIKMSIKKKKKEKSKAKNWVKLKFYKNASYKTDAIHGYSFLFKFFKKLF